MNEQARYWWREAQESLETARVLLANARYLEAGFFGHLAFGPGRGGDGVAGAATEVMRAVERYIAALRERIPVEKVILFGSYATGRVYDDSDIDLAVFSPAFGRNPLADRQLLYQVLLESEADPRIEAHPFPCGPVRGARAVFLEEIMASGRVVYERGEVLR